MPKNRDAAAGARRGGGGRAGELRIIAGTHRGHRIRVPAGGGVRPTGDRIREAVFSALGDMGGARVLDLFAGTGALGLESLSRGAERCVFVERDGAVVEVLRRNIEALGMQDRCEIMPLAFEGALQRLLARGERFDLLFVDPPYTMLALIDGPLSGALAGLLERGGLVVVEGPVGVEARLGLPSAFQRRYGKTLISIYAEEHH